MDAHHSISKRVPDEPNIDVLLARVFRHPARIRIIRALHAAPDGLTRSTLANLLHLDDVLLARHLHTLQRSGVVTSRKHGSMPPRYLLSATPFAYTVVSMLGAANAPSMPPSFTPQSPTSHQIAFNLVLNQMPSGVAIYDRAGHLIRVNAVGERITTRHALPGESVSARRQRYNARRLDGSLMPDAEIPSSRALKGESFSDVPCLIDGQDGPNTCLLTSGAPLLDAHGQIHGAVVVFHNVTAQRALEHEQVRQRALAEGIISGAPVGIAVYDVTDAFRCLSHNEMFLRLVGPLQRATGSLQGVPLDDFFDQASRTRIRGIFEQVRASGVPATIEEFSAMLAHETKPRWYRWSLTPLYDDQSNLYALLCCAVEITELVSAREQIRQHAATLQAVIASMPEAVAVADRDGNFLLTNEVAEELWGRATSSEIATSLRVEAFPCYGPDGELLASDRLPLSRALAGDTVIGQELTYLRPDGGKLDLLCNAAPVFDDQSSELLGGVVIFQDITRLKSLERQRDDFLSIAAHELRTPLTTILGTLQVMSRQIMRASEKPLEPAAFVRGLDRMQRQAQRIHKLVGELLDTTRIQAGRLEFTLAPCDIVALVRDAVDGQVMAHPSRRITTTLPPEPIETIADAVRMAQVLDNLLSNALKYSHEDYPVEVALESDGCEAHLCVTDHGPGIPIESQEHLFERFYRVPGVEVESGSGVGLGLGLYIARTIVERHGGRIWVESGRDAGAIFHVALPLTAALPSGSHAERNPSAGLFSDSAMLP